MTTLLLFSGQVAGWALNVVDSLINGQSIQVFMNYNRISRCLKFRLNSWVKEIIMGALWFNSSYLTYARDISVSEQHFGWRKVHNLEIWSDTKDGSQSSCLRFLSCVPYHQHIILSTISKLRFSLASWSSHISNRSPDVSPHIIFD